MTPTIITSLACVLMTSVGWAEQPSIVAHAADRVYTSPTDPPIHDGVVVIQDGKVVSVGSKDSVAIPASAVVHEHKGSTIVAGLWNSHVHFMEADFANAAKASAETLTSHLRRMLLQYGFVHVYQVAALDLQATRILRERIQRGEVLGPSILSTGQPFVAPGGTPGYIVGMTFPSLSDEIAARQAVRKQLADGAEGIKLMPLTANHRGHYSMSLDVARAAVSETHANDKLVFAHPTNVRGLKIALSAGADVIVHTSPDDLETWDEQIVAEMKRADVALIPTLKLYQWDPARQGAPPDLVRRVSAAAVQQLELYARRGGVVLFGTDVGYMTDHDPTDEYLLMAEAGLTFEQILASLTTAPSQKVRLGRSNRSDQARHGCRHRDPRWRS